jgi:hypothetical protein
VTLLAASVGLTLFLFALAYLTLPDPAAVPRGSDGQADLIGLYERMPPTTKLTFGVVGLGGVLLWWTGLAMLITGLILPER